MCKSSCTNIENEIIVEPTPHNHSANKIGTIINKKIRHNMKTRSRIETLPVSKIYLEEFGKGVRD